MCYRLVLWECVKKPSSSVEQHVLKLCLRVLYVKLGLPYDIQKIYMRSFFLLNNVIFSEN